MKKVIYTGIEESDVIGNFTRSLMNELVIGNVYDVVIEDDCYIIQGVFDTNYVFSMWFFVDHFGYKYGLI